MTLRDQLVSVCGLFGDSEGVTREQLHPGIMKIGVSEEWLSIMGMEIPIGIHQPLLIKNEIPFYPKLGLGRMVSKVVNTVTQERDTN